VSGTAVPHAHDDDATRQLTALRARGKRLTRQRRLVWDVLVAGDGEHLSAEAVIARVQAKMPGLHTSTVYRNLETLVDEGLVRRTNLGGDRAYCEPRHDHRHHHIVCEGCGEVAHLHDDVLGRLPARIEAASRFTLGDSEVTFFGTCATCRATGA
jgi:Fur family ferric uptake transcriptional regulator